MPSRKITVDNSVKYNPQSEQTQSIAKDRTKNVSNHRKQNKMFSQNKRNFIKDNISAEGFTLPKGVLNCYF